MYLMGKTLGTKQGIFKKTDHKQTNLWNNEVKIILFQLKMFI